MDIPKKILEEIEEFCKLNEIKDKEKFMLSIFQTGFNVEKYGNAPWKQEIEKIVEKEVVKEIVVEKEIFVTDDEKVNALGKELNNLKDEIRQKEEEIIKNAQNMKSLNGEIENKKGEITNLSDKLKEVNKNLEEIKIDQPKPFRDIYGETGKGGFWGSNLKDKK
jgi:chromosome segregation ATPase